MTATDVLVVGGGPAGAAVAQRLATAGHDVTLVEKRATPRHKACGDALTPRALAELDELGIDPLELGGHSIRGVRLRHGDRAVEVPWPSRNAEGDGSRDSADTHGGAPHALGSTLRRSVLDEALRDRARAAGAAVSMGYEATNPILERGFVRGATMRLADGSTQDLRARFLVVADGANSRFGRGLGTTRERNWPYGIAARTYFESPRSGDDWTEARLGPRDPAGNPIAGFGWLHPIGDGTVNVGVGMLSSYRDAAGVNALKLLDEFARDVAAEWHFDPDAALKDPGRMRLPLGGSVGPKMGPTFLVVGDAGGLANPLSGDGIDAALLSARVAADVLHEALTTGNSTTLQRYPIALAEEVGRFHAVGRLTARFLGRPAVLRPVIGLATQSPAIAGGMMRIATRQLRSDAGGAERAYRLARLASRFAPSW